MSKHGVVNAYSSDLGVGVVIDDDDGESYAVALDQLPADLAGLQTGQKVEFDVSEHDRVVTVKSLLTEDGVESLDAEDVLAGTAQESDPPPDKQEPAPESEDSTTPACAAPQPDDSGQATAAEPGK